jgi:hypothetical protein
VRAVWSLWTRPLFEGPGERWSGGLKANLLSWVLSFETIRSFYPQTKLYSDSLGVDLLVERLGLGFQSVSAQLDGLQGYDPSWWALGKLFAYASEEEPFIHFDNDVFLWRALPEAVTSCALVAQNPEVLTEERKLYYRPEALEMAASKACNGWLPKEWRWYRNDYTGDHYAVCCGVFGGHDLDFIHRYAGLGFELLDSGAIAALEKKEKHMILIEQFLLAATIEYERSVLGATREVGYVLASPDCPKRPRVGFTHLLGPSKRNPAVIAKLEEMVKSKYPETYERCLDVVKTMPAPG